MKIVLQDLTKIFPSRNKKSTDEVVAVDHFNFEIPDGKLIGLLGPSGCGKSTTLYMISGLQKPTAGKIFFGEDDVTELSTEKRGIGLVFQNYALYPHMTVLQNILFPLQNLTGPDKLTKVQMIERAQQAARLVQIEELLDRKPSELSGGQQQRVAIARALVKPQEVYDDPANLFVAKFLGTPPINVFKGRTEGGWLYLDNERVLNVGNVPDQDVMVGIRPEGFIIDPNGPMHCRISSVEVMGRDVSVVSTHPALVSPSIRSIVDADNKIDPAQQTIAYRIKPHKLFIFDSENEKRIPFEVK